MIVLISTIQHFRIMQC